MNTKERLQKDIEVALNDLEQLADEVRLKLHLVGMDAETRWKEALEPRLFAAREDLKQIAVESERQGALTAAERAMIHNVVDFRTVKVADVMVPLGKVVSVKPDATISQVLALSVRTGIDRLPVISKKSALGLVTIFDILLDRDPSRELRHYRRRIISAADNESAYRIIRRLRAARLTLAAVKGRRGNLIGIVTIEDLVRRLVQSA